MYRQLGICLDNKTWNGDIGGGGAHFVLGQALDVRSEIRQTFEMEFDEMRIDDFPAWLFD